ncbi:hypothetical protein COOONC_02452 [Cooperia oncophora]
MESGKVGLEPLLKQRSGILVDTPAMRFLSRVSLALLLATATLAQYDNGEDYDYKDYNGGDNGNNGGNTGGQVKPPAPAPAPVAPVVTTTVNPNNMRCPQNSGVNDRIRNAALEGHNYRRSNLAKGSVTNKNNKNLPPARNMLKLVSRLDLNRLIGGAGKNNPL